ncbi:asparagine synthase (glutamine-hydrolyzing) [Candidatus Pelagibacter communis]|uniref:asparagine synthase (glutamine-hydrolyzing) n=1 Tax=Pelagibacter ubique TaxID=198252 RepID=UPI00094DC640|nr:asparagine synthase (glutamine-hydrolyzing) [Candidatus Pelagibacter ubique]
MCGIFAFFSKHKDINQNLLIDLKSSSLSMHHRGPDNFSEHISKNYYLGHCRLSIIDLDIRANQPFRSNDLICVFNGEIFNFKQIKNELLDLGIFFSTDSDTEVLLKSYEVWGKDCLIKFNGMFSFVIINEKTQKIFVARDRFGEKPLYVFNDNNYLIFSSEMKAILNIKSINFSLNNESIYDLFSNGYSSSISSIVKNIKKIKPGTFLEIDNNFQKIKENKFWKIPEYSNENLSEKKLIEEFDYLLSDAVKLRTISDVGYGMLLSGGLDSSLISYYAKKENPDLRAYTFTNANENKYDEKKYSELISQAFKINTNFLDLKNINISEILDKLPEIFDEPLFDSSLIPSYSIFKEAKKYSTVLLTGDGGDELFGGYKRYSNLVLNNKIKLILRLNKLNNNNFVKNQIKKLNSKWLNSIFCNELDAAVIVNQIFSENEIYKLFGIKRDSLENINKDINLSQKSDIIYSATQIDLLNYLPNDINSKIDISSMVNSVEARAPFLDFRVVEFAFSKIKSDDKTDFTRKKIFLSKVAQKYFPKKYKFNRKQGFEININKLMVQNLSKIQESIFYSNFGYQKKYITNLFNDFKKGRRVSEKIFGLYFFESWRQKYKLN